MFSSQWKKDSSPSFHQKWWKLEKKIQSENRKGVKSSFRTKLSFISMVQVVQFSWKKLEEPNQENNRNISENVNFVCCAYSFTFVFSSSNAPPTWVQCKNAKNIWVQLPDTLKQVVLYHINAGGFLCLIYFEDTLVSGNLTQYDLQYIHNILWMSHITSMGPYLPKSWGFEYYFHKIYGPLKEKAS